MSWISYFILFSLSTFLVKIFCGYAQFKGMVDVPNARSSHEVITPRGAGIVFASLWCLYLYWQLNQPNSFLIAYDGLLPGAILIAVLGYLDDYKQLSIWLRLLVQIGVALLCVYFLGNISKFYVVQCAWSIGIFGIPVILFAIVWSINLFNFMDGLDGLAGLEGVFLFGMGGLLFFLNGYPEFASLAWALMAGVAGFLVWNWPYASVFMGSAGSYFLGFMAILFALVGEKIANLPIGLWLMMYSVFWFDASITLMRRMLTGQKWYMAHRSHAFQRLHQAGWSVSNILYGMIALNSFLACMVLWAYYERSQMMIAWYWVLSVLTFVYLAIEYLYPMKKCKTEQGSAGYN